LSRKERSILGGFFVYTFLGFLPLSFSFFFIPIYTKYLSVEEFGILNYFTVFSSLLMPIVSLSIEQIAGFKYWDYRKLDERMNYILNLLLLSILILFVITPIIFQVLKLGLFSLKVNLSKIGFFEYILLAILFAYCTNIYRVILSVFRNEKLLNGYSLLSLSYLASLVIGSVFGLIIYNRGLMGAIEGRTIGFMIVMFFCISFLFLNYRKLFRINLNILKSTLFLSFPLIFSQLIGNFSYSFDKLFIEKFFGLKSLGLYSFAFSIAYILDILLNALSNVVIPDIFEKIKYEDSLNKRIVFGFFDFAILISSLFGLVSFLFIKFFINQDYYASFKVLLILSLVIIPKSIQVYYSLYYYRDNRTKMLLYQSIIYLIVSTTAFYLLGNYFSITGIAYGVLISNWVSLYFTIFFSKTDLIESMKKRVLISACFLIFYNFLSLVNIFELNIFLATSILLIPSLSLSLFYFFVERKRLFYYGITLKHLVLKK
jgi:O-antigen/teichoic acid export membrane protein